VPAFQIGAGLGEPRNCQLLCNFCLTLSYLIDLHSSQNNAHSIQFIQRGIPIFNPLSNIPNPHQRIINTYSIHHNTAPFHTATALQDRSPPATGTLLAAKELGMDLNWPGPPVLGSSHRTPQLFPHFWEQASKPQHRIALQNLSFPMTYARRRSAPDLPAGCCRAQF
jgi:hypothetical protein